VALSPAEATDAATPVAEGHTLEGAVIVAFGAADILTDLVVAVEQPAEVVTVKAKETEPLVPAVYTIIEVPFPEVIVPLVIDHAYDNPVPVVLVDA
jgi:hypothetical protein